MRPWTWNTIHGSSTLHRFIAEINSRMKGLEAALASTQLRSLVLSGPSLRITGGAGSASAETQTGFTYVAGGVMGTVAALTSLPTLVGTVPNGQFGVFVWLVDASGSLTQLPVRTGTSMALLPVVSPLQNQAVVGYLIVNPTGTGDFVGGTTLLDDGTVVPNCLFLNANDFGGVG